MDETHLPLLTRLWFAWVAWFRVLFDGGFASRVFAVAHSAPPRVSAPPKPELLPERDMRSKKTAEAAGAHGNASPADPLESALQLLGLLQREGRFVDFVQQEIAAFGDAEVGAAARVVHEGCRRALGSHARIVNVRLEEEGTAVTVETLDANRIKLTGEVTGSAPYRGVLRHRGWRIEQLNLPTRVGEQDLRVVAPAEVELG